MIRRDGHHSWTASTCSARRTAALPIVAMLESDDAAATHDHREGQRPDLRDEDLHELLAAFYERVARDPRLAPYFAAVDMPAHLPRIVGFWSTLLFHTGRYSGSAFRPHQSMPALTAEHFTRWLGVLELTVDARFAGPTADQMKVLGHRIASSMQLRLGITPERGYPAPERGGPAELAPVRRR